MALASPILYGLNIRFLPFSDMINRHIGQVPHAGPSSHWRVISLARSLRASIARMYAALMGADGD